MRLFTTPVISTMALCLALSLTESNIMAQSPSTLADHIHTLISVDQNIALKNWSLSHQDLDLGTESLWRISLRQLYGGRQEGVQVIQIDNGMIQMSLIPTRGMAIYEVRKGELRLGWDSPVHELVHPKFVNLEENGGLGFLSGFNEWMTRCGVEFAGHPGDDNGQFLTLHGKIANIPASEVQVIIDPDPPHRIRIRGRVDESWFKGPDLQLWTEVSMLPGSDEFRIDDEVINLADKEQEIMMLYHVNFGPPILEEGSQLHGTVEKVVPFDDFAETDINNWNKYSAPVRNIAERVYCLYPKGDANDQAYFLIKNADGSRAVSFKQSIKQLPYLTQWKNMDSNGYVTGLEPGTSFPHNRSVERKYGRVPILGVGGRQKFSISYRILDDSTTISNEIEKINSINGKTPSVEHKVIAK